MTNADELLSPILPQHKTRHVVFFWNLTTHHKILILPVLVLAILDRIIHNVEIVFAGKLNMRKIESVKDK